MLLANAGMGLQLAGWDIWSHPNPPQTAASWISSDTWMLVSLLHVFLALTIKKKILRSHIIGRSCSYNILLLEMQHSYMKIQEKGPDEMTESTRRAVTRWALSNGRDLLSWLPWVIPRPGFRPIQFFINNLDERVESPFVRVSAKSERHQGGGD